MRLHSMNLQDEHFNNIKSGKKIYECRIYDEKRKNLALLDCIVFNCKNKHHKVFITELSYFDSFENALTSKSLERILPDITSITEGVSIYHNIDGYAEKEAQMGVICIKFMAYEN